MSNSIPPFEVKSLKKIDNPVLGTGSIYMAIVDVRLLPKALQNWRKINVRDPKLTHRVARDIRDSLLSTPDEFHMKNRGITLIAESLVFDNKAGIVRINMTDPESHGLLDGGHTYNVILEALDKMPQQEYDDFEGYVRVEIMEGIEKDLAISIVEARNNSLQVQDESIAELRNEFNLIKKSVKNESYANNVAYKQFEWNEDGDPKEISVSELLSALMCFDTDNYDDMRHPTGAAMTKKRVLTHFKAAKPKLLKFVPLLPDFLKLRDHIYHDLPLAYNRTGGRYGGLSCAKEKEIQLKFEGSTAEYFVPIGFVYPILAAFRNLLVVKGNTVTWERDPFIFWKSIQEKASASIIESAMRLHSPAYVSKDPSVWANLYRMVELEKTRV